MKINDVVKCENCGEDLTPTVEDIFYNEVFCLTCREWQVVHGGSSC